MGGLTGRVVVGITSAALAASPGVQAADSVPVKILSDGPVLAGDKVVVVEGYSPRVMEAAEPGRPLDRLAGFDAMLAHADGVAIAASATRLLVGASTARSTSDVTRPLSSRLVTAPFGGELTDLRLCGVTEFGRGASMSVDGDVVAYGSRSTNGCAEVVVRDLGTPAAGSASFPFGFRIQVAGNFLATMSYSSIDVYDWRRHEQLYSVPVRDSGYTTFSLQSDGTMAVVSPGPPAPVGSRPRCGSYDLAVASVTQPALRALPFHPCAPTGLYLRSDRLVFMAAAQDSPERSIFVLTDPSGSTSRQLTAATRFGDRSEDLSDVIYAGGRGGIDFDGERLAYMDRPCVGRRIIVDTVASVQANGPVPEQVCPVRWRPGRTLRFSRGGTATTMVTCPNGCRGGVVVSRRQTNLSPELLGMREMQFGASASPRRLTVRLYGQAIHELRRRGRLRATVSCHVFQPDGTDGTIKRTVELRYPRGRRRG